MIFKFKLNYYIFFSKRQLITELQVLGLTKKQKKEKFDKRLHEIVKNYFYQGKKDKETYNKEEDKNIN